MINEGDNTNNNMVLKYQLGPEDLDALISVRTDEDLKHMLHEYDRQAEKTSEGSPKLRTFLFPSPQPQQQSLMESQCNNSIEQRYIDAINGVVRTRNNNRQQQQQPPKIPPIVINSGAHHHHHPTTFTISACSSPNSNSPERQAMENNGHEMFSSSSSSNNNINGYNLHRVRSSPTLCRSNSPQRLSSGYRPQAYHYGLPQHNHLLDLQKAAASERLAPALSMARGEFRRGVFGHGGGGGGGGGGDHQYYTSRPDFSGYGNFHGIDRDENSHPKSPRKKFWE